MGLFDIFFKKKTVETIAKEKINYSGLNDFLSKEKEIISQEKSDFNDLVNSYIKDLSSDLKEKSGILKEINLDDKKAPVRAKTIVLENLNNYINYLDKLIERLLAIDASKEKDLFK